MTGDELEAARTAMRVRPEAMAAALCISDVQYEALEGSQAVPKLYALAVSQMLEHPEERPRPHPDDVQISASPFDPHKPLSELYDGQQWGPWRLSRTSCTLDLHSHVAFVESDSEGAPVYE